MKTSFTQWIKTNALEVVLAAMLTAFFVNYQADRIETKEFRDEIRSVWQEHEEKLTILYFAIIADTNLTETQKQILKEYAPKRGGTIIKK